MLAGYAHMHAVYYEASKRGLLSVVASPSAATEYPIRGLPSSPSSQSPTSSHTYSSVYMMGVPHSTTITRVPVSWSTGMVSDGQPHGQLHGQPVFVDVQVLLQRVETLLRMPNAVADVGVLADILYVGVLVIYCVCIVVTTTPFSYPGGHVPNCLSSTSPLLSAMC